MSHIEQIPFGAESFAENPEDRCPCVLVIDVSASMTGEPIRQLQQGLHQYRDELADDLLASKRVEVAVITFGGVVKVLQDFTTIEQFNVPQLQATGDTPMGAALLEAVRLVNDRKKVYREHGVNYYRPWIFLITDGEATDGRDRWDEAKRALQNGVEKRAFSCFAVGVKGADMRKLAELPAQNGPLPLDGVRFRDLFLWLSRSQQAIAKSQPGTAVALPAPSWIVQT